MKPEDHLSEEQIKQMQGAWPSISSAYINQGLDFHYFAYVYVTAVWLVNKRVSERPFLFSVSGAQGSGKSTFSNLLAKLLLSLFAAKTIVLSLDDFYLKKSERVQLAKDIHPLLKTRGVPGTHDLGLMHNVLTSAKSGTAFNKPIFDKALDDRAGTKLVDSKALDFIIFEGWCWGAQAVNPDALYPAINSLEENEDRDGAWREYVNQRLFTYQDVFSTDAALFLGVPDMGSVLEWRLQQEEGLPIGSNKMNREDISRFIMFYERITRDMLVSMPKQVEIYLSLDKDHHIENSIFSA